FKRIEPTAKDLASFSAYASSQGIDGVRILEITELSNNGKSASSFSLVVGGVDGWGEATLSPAPTLILEPGASGTFTLTIATSKKASGLKKVQIELLNSESKQVGQSQVQLEITPAPKTDLRAILEIAVIVLAALMIILLIVSTLRKGARSEVYY
ncbi:MAG: hypothetical protein QXN46_02495, partial [Candidatus Woesearchaeota archaeon]